MGAFLLGFALGAAAMRGGAWVWARARVVELQDAHGEELDRLARLGRYREESLKLQGFAREVVASEARAVRAEERRNVVPIPRTAKGEVA